jgi:capsule polysaccharide export protein KpsE/RkpR
MANETANPQEVLVENLDPNNGRNGAAGNQRARARAINRLRIIWEHRSLVARTTAVGLCLSILFAFLIPARYESTARLMPPDQESGTATAMMAAMMGKFSATAGGLGGDLLGLKTSGDLFAGVLKSRTVQDDLISKFDLLKVYGYRRREDARDRLEDRTSISVERKSGIITITVADHKPERAAGLARAYVDELNRMMTQLSTSSARREREFLEQRLAQVKDELENSEKEFSQFASKNTAIDIESQGKAMIGAAANLEGQLIAAQTELEGLKQIYSDNNIRVRSLQARVDELQRQTQKLGGRSSDVALAGDDDRFVYPTIRKLPILGVNYADLYRAMKVQDIVFATLTQQYEYAKVQEAKEIPSVKVLDSPDIPEKRSFPPRMQIVIVGTLLAALLSVFWVLGRQQWQEIAPDDPARVFTQDVLGTVKSRFNSLSGNGFSDSRSSRLENASGNGHDQASGLSD